MVKNDEDKMPTVEELQQDTFKVKYGIGQDFNSELEVLICDTYHVSDITTLFKANLQLKPFNTTYALTTKPSSISKEEKEKLSAAGITDHINCWKKLFNYFLPRWLFLYVNKSKKALDIGVDWAEYMKEYFQAYPIETFSQLESGIEYKEPLGAWKRLNNKEMFNVFNKQLIKTLGRWGIRQSHTLNAGITQTRNLAKAYTLNRRANTPEELVTPYLVAFRNGTYNFRTNELQAHNKNDYLLNLHDYIVDLNHPHAPNTDKLLNEMVGDAATFLKEFIGFCFYPNHSTFQDFVLLHGASGEGKSTLLNFIKEYLIGPDNFSALDPQTMGDRNNRFATSDLYSKELNVVPDISDKLIQDVSALKGLVGGDSIRAEFKGQSSFTFVSRAKNIWSANHLPALRSSDANSALADRANVIKFINGDTRKSSNHFWQHHDMEKVKAERPQFVGECLELFHKVLKRHQQGLGRDSWTRPTSIKQATNEWLKHNDPVAEWLENVKENNPSLFQDGYFKKDDAYSDYRFWCNAEGRTIMSKKKLGDKLCSDYGFENKKVYTSNGQHLHSWVNKELKNEWNKIINDWSKTRPTINIG